MFVAALGVAAVVPSLLLLWYFHSRDLHPEPGRVLWATFGLGIATIPFVLVLAWPMQSAVVAQIENPYLNGLASAFLTAAMPEELMKLVVVLGYCARHREFDEPMDGIVYGAAASLGFATLENLLYVSGGGLGLALMRALTAVPAHAFLGAIMGYFVGQARFAPEGRGRRLLLAYVVPTLLHGLYDFPLLTMGRLGDAPDGALVIALPAIALGTLIASGVTARGLAKRLRAEQTSRRDHGLQVGAAWGPTGDAAAATAPSPAFVNAPVTVPADAPVGRGLGVFLAIMGGIIAAAGGLVVLGIVAAFATGGVDESERVPILVGTFIAGALPLLLGMGLLSLGLKRLRRARGALLAALPPPDVRLAG